MGRLEGKTAAVTGAGTGIGRAAAQRLASEGASVLVTDKDYSLAQETADLIMEKKGHAYPLKVDVRNIDEVAKIPEMIEKQFGTPLRIMVNNAGFQQVKDILDITPEDWDNMIAVNARGVFFGMQAATRSMKKEGQGSIINISSIMGRDGHPLYAHYAASKSSIISLTKSFALATAQYNIRVNSVGPGIIDTNLWEVCDTQMAELKGMKKGEPRAQRIGEIPLQRAGIPEDVSGAVAFLASSDASYITGECIHVSGGAYML